MPGGRGFKEDFLSLSSGGRPSLFLSPNWPEKCPEFLLSTRWCELRPMNAARIPRLSRVTAVDLVGCGEVSIVYTLYFIARLSRVTRRGLGRLR